MKPEGPPVKAVELMREIRDKINAEMEGKSFEEIRRILHERATTSDLWRKLEERDRTPTSSR
jgi:hypothetical protein